MGVSFRYGYDEDTGRCIKTWGDGGRHEVDLHYDLEARITRTSGTGEPREYHWRDDGLVVEERTHDGSFVRVREYDDDQYLLSETNAAGETTRYEYDYRGNLTRLIDAAGNETSWTFSEDYPQQRTGPDGLETHYQHDHHGALVSVRYPSGLAYSLDYDDHGRLSQVHGPRGLLAAFRYDTHHNLAEELDARGAKTFYASEPLGRPRLRIDALGRQTTVTYDRLRQPVQVVYPDGSQSQAGYDPLGHVSHFTDALGQQTEMAYGGTGVLEELTSPDGFRWRFSYDSDERLRRIENPRRERYEFEYDPAGRITEERAFDGRILGYRYDDAERLRRIDYPDQSWREFVYDPLGNVLGEASPHGAIRFERDELGRLERAVVEDPWGDVETSFERDELGRVIAEHQLGRTLRFGYDAEGRRQERILPGGETTRYQYDALGALTALEHDGTRVDITRDELGRESRKLVRESQVTLDSSYDQLDRLVGQRVSAPAPQGQGAYQALSERRYHYDRLGRPTRIDDSRFGPTEYHYDRIGQLVQAKTARGLEVFEYDPAGSLLNALSDLEQAGKAPIWEVGPGNILKRAGAVGFENDKRGRRTARTETVTAPDGTTSEQRTEYDWDCRDRLREVRLPDGRTVRFRYDAFGRRVDKRVLPAERADLPRMVELALVKGPEALPQAEVVGFVWDGDVLCADVGAVAAPKAAAGSDGAEPGEGLSAAARVARELERQGREGASGGDEEEGSADPWGADGRAVRVFVHEVGTFVPVLQAEGGHVFTYVTDHLGTPKELVDDKGRVAWAVAHSAWGKVEQVWRDPAARPAQSPFRLLGQYHDAETGLCYTRFRYFDPQHGRWCSPDPLGIGGGLNLLGFDGTPSFQVDPLGLACKAKQSTRLAWVIKALRARGTPLALAVAALVKRGLITVVFRPKSLTRPTIQGERPWGKKSVTLFTDNINSAEQAAGVLAHEAKHVLQDTSPSSHTKTHEVEAYVVQAAVDPKFPLRTEQEIRDFVNSEPVYKDYPP